MKSKQPSIRRFDPAELSRRLTGQTGTRAPLVVWMIEHYAELEQIIAIHHVNWNTMTEYVSELGIKSAQGTPLKPNNVRACWGRAKKVVEQRAVKLASAPVATQPPESHA